MPGQTTQGLVSGVVRDSSGTAVNGAWVSFCRMGTDGVIRDRDSVAVDKNGFYVLPRLTPGDYRMRVEVGEKPDPPEKECFQEPKKETKYQAQEKHDLVLGVGARMEVDFDLRLVTEVRDKVGASYLTPSEMVVRYFGTDARTMKSLPVDTRPASQQSGGTTVSYDIDPRALERLPLTGRDVYALLTLMPGVTADTSTGRGLGLSVNGQRPTASNYMLDGVENNNTLVTGPLSPVAPEAVQEYRISTNNYSAEFGRTTGFLANAITRAPGQEWHGVGYLYGKHEKLNAADFQQNQLGYGRTPLREFQPGFSVGGPVVKERLFAGASLEYLRYRGRLDPQTVELPDGMPAGPIAKGLLTKYPPPRQGTVKMAPSSTLDRVFGTPRVDYVSEDGKHRVMGRVAVADYNQPDAGWTPYKDFLTPLTQRSVGVAGAVTSSLGRGVTNELRGGWTATDIRYDTPHPEVPILVSQFVQLPGPRTSLNLWDHTNVAQVSDTLLWATAKHQVKAGGGYLHRVLDNYLKLEGSGYVDFATLADFYDDKPNLFKAPISRREFSASESGKLNLRVPQFDRTYRAADWYVFAQDSFRVRRWLSLDYGVRHDLFGAPVNTGAVKDGLIQPGPGVGLPAQLAGARMVIPAAGDQPLYDTDRGNFAGRFGFAAMLDSRGSLALRGGAGVFYERPFDNLWANIRNNNVTVIRQDAEGVVDYLAPVQRQLGRYSGLRKAEIHQSQETRPTLYATGMKNGRTGSYFLSLQKQVSATTTLEVNGLGARGKRLMVTDRVNRSGNGLSDLDLKDLSYRTDQGSSIYSAMTVVARHRGAFGLLQASYSLSHSIDNQSDPLVGEIALGGLDAGDAGFVGDAAFSRQFDFRADRGNSDFDQRHNFVVYWVSAIPAPVSAGRLLPYVRDWRVATVAAIRSGLPFSALANSSPGEDGDWDDLPTILNNRADIVDPGAVRSGGRAPAGVKPLEGGRYLLNPAALAEPGQGTLGNSGRNAFAGPGFFGLDVSLSRTFPLPGKSDRARAVVRLDAYNVLNHANLNNPARAAPGEAAFGFASYGRSEPRRSPIQGPLRETSRQLQVLLRLEF